MGKTPRCAPLGALKEDVVAGQPTVDASAPDVHISWSYRPHLDGMRAFAVYLVVAFHAGMGRFLGGFIGVDVFFVLSGYLVSHVLLGDLVRTGRVGLGRFYSRRVRRLLPAAAINLVAVAFVFRAIAAPVELADAREAIRAAALYFSNWFFIAESSDYFGADITNSPVAHYWSLSIEEQFYLLWPLALGGLFALTRRVGRHQMAVISAVVAIAGLASLVQALVVSRTDLNRAYYGTDTRAYQLLAGAFLALTPGVVVLVRRWVRPTGVLPVLSLAAGLGIGLASSSLFERGPIVRGIAATLLTCVLIVTLEATDGGFAKRVLSLSPLVYLGRISYGTYLWHWIVVIVIIREFELDPLSAFAYTAVIASGVAALSYELIERPIRLAPNGPRLRTPVIASGLCISLLIGILAAPEILDRTRSGAPEQGAVTVTSGGTPNDADWESAFYDTYDYDQCPPGVDDACILTQGAGKNVMVVGESHAAVLIPMLTRVAERHDWSLTGGLMPFCPWTRGMQYSNAGKNCLTDQARLFDKIIPEVDPDIVILAHRPVDDRRNSLTMTDEDDGKINDPAQQATRLEERIRAVVADLRRDGRTVVLIEPTPAAPEAENPLTCLSESPNLEPCRFVSSVTPTAEEAVFRDLAAADSGVVDIDFDRQVCPYLPICDPVVNGLVVKRDDTHLTTRFGVSMLDWFDQQLLDAGVEI